MGPSVSYSITVRLEVASRGRAVSAITRAVEQAGGVVTALDVTAGRGDKLRPFSLRRVPWHETL